MKFCPYHLFVNKNEGPFSFGGHDCPGVEGIRERVKNTISEIADSTEEKINELKKKVSSTLDGSDESQENGPTSSEPVIEESRDAQIALLHNLYSAPI